MLRYGLYTRKSHDDKKLTEKSTGEQLTECRALAHGAGLKIEWLCEESKSAKVPGKRPLYTELVTLIEKGKVDALLCWHVNRLVRNMEEGGKLVQLLVDGKIKEIRTPHSVYRSGENILAVVIEAASATQHSIDLTHTVKRSSRGNFVVGGWNHRAPPGYRNIRDPLNSKRGQVEPDPERWPLIRKVWDTVLAGEENVASVTRSLEAWGYRVRPSLNTRAGPLSYQAVRALLQNPFYLGFVRELGELHPSRHPAMVTHAEFQRVQELLGRRSFRAKRAYFHAYAGMMKCGHCGQYVTAETKRLKSGPWEIYHCSDSYNRCTQKGLSAASVEAELVRLARSIDIDPESLELGISQVSRGLSHEQEALVTRRELQHKALTEVSKRIEKLTEMWLSGLLTDSERYKTMEGSLISEKERLTLAVAGEQHDVSRAVRNVAVAAVLLRVAPSRMPEVPSKLKRTIAQSLGTYKFYGTDKRIELELNPCLREIVAVLSGKSAPLEPPKSASGKCKDAPLQEHLCFGGGNTSGIELPEPLLLALTTEDLTLPPGFELEMAALGLQEAA